MSQIKIIICWHPQAHAVVPPVVGAGAGAGAGAGDGFLVVDDWVLDPES